MEIAIMSSNVWGNCPADRPIADRDDKMAKVYFRYLPDAIGLQECSVKLREEKINLFDLIKDAYEEVPVTPTNDIKNNFTPIVYRRDRLDLEDCGWHCFSGLNDKGSKSITWALFCDKSCGERFIHLNMHYFWTSDEPGREARISNSREMLAIVSELTEKYQLPIILTGDFNCCTHEPPIAAIVEAGFEEARLCARQSVEPFCSLHPYPEIDDSDPRHITYPRGYMPGKDIDKSIDHIFVTPDITVKSYVTVVDNEALEASDHCPLIVNAVVG